MAPGVSGDCDVSEKSAEANLARRNWRGTKKRTIKHFGSHLGKHMGNTKIMDNRFRNSRRWEVPGGRKTKLAPDGGVHLACDCDQRRRGRASDGKYACFECGDTTRDREECPVYVDKINLYNENGKGGGWKIEFYR